MKKNQSIWSFSVLVIFLFLIQYTFSSPKTSENQFLSYNNSYRSIINSNYFIDIDVKNPIDIVNNVGDFNKEIYHLFSHGRSGELYVNGKWLNKQQIVSFIKNLKLSATSLNIYGCEFAKGKKGKQAVSYIEKETGLKVSASTNITGKDGDWILEIGKNTNLNIPNYNYSLQTIGGTGDNDDYDGDGVINIDDLDDDNDGILDTVEAKCFVSEFINNPSPACTITGGSLEQAGVTAGTSGEDLPISVGYSVYASSINPGITRNQGVTIATICSRLSFSPFNSPIVVQGVNPLTGEQTEIGDITLQSDCAGGNEIPWVEFYDSTGTIIGSRLDVDPNLGTDDCRSFDTPSGTYYVKYGNTLSASRITNITLTGANSALCENPDTDNDGIPNHFDLDSDGDGCPDAVEGDGTFSNGQLVDSSLDGGNTGAGFTGNTGVSPVIQNLGNTVDTSAGSSTLGVPTVAGSGQNIGISENKAIENCADTDGDGINDYVDIDDDNDGILDTTELGCGRGFATGQVDNSNLMSGTFTFGSASADFTNAITGAQMFAQNTRFANGVHYLVIDRTPTSEFQEVITVTSESGTVLNTIVYGNEVATQNLNSANGAQDITFTWDSGGLATVVDPNNKLSLNDGATFASGTTISVDATGNSENDIWFIEFDAALTSMMTLTVNHNADSGLSSETFGFDASLCSANDDDQDGTLNHQQVDSDGDGCSDATEAGVSGVLNDEGTLENAIAQAPYGANGLANGVETSEDSGEVNYQDTYQNARDNNTNTCLTDTDGDNINDDVDLDDDNDGILDSDECSNTRNFVEFAASDVASAIGNNLPGTITGPDQNGNMVTITFSAVEGTSTSGAQVGNANTTTNGIQFRNNSRLVTGLRVEATVPMYGVQYTDFNDVDNDVAVLPNPMPDGSACPAPPQRNERDVWGIDQAGVYTILAGNLAVPTSHIGSDLPDLASKYEQLGVSQLIIGNPEELSCGANQEVTPNTIMDDTTLNFLAPTTVFRMYGSNAAPDFITTATTIDPVGTYRYYLSPQGCQDTDGDGIPNNLDLDSDADGCPDAVEGDGSFTAADNDLVTDTNIAGGSSNVQQNLGSSSNDDGTPNIEGTITTDSETQGAGNAYSYGTNTECCTDAENYTAILDTDGDNIGDNCDLDDDNDGILDVDENCVATSEAIHNGTTPFDSDETSTGTTVTVSTQQVNANVGIIGNYNPPRSFVFNGQQRVEYTSAVQINPDATSNETIITYTFSNPILASDVGIMIEDIDRGLPTGSISVSGGTATTADFSVQSVLRNGESGESPEINYNRTTGGIDFPSAPSGTNRYASLISGQGSNTLTELRLIISNLGNGGSNGDNVRIYLVPIVNCDNDLDGDGIPNNLDLDSDADGCPDAVEGDGSFTAADNDLVTDTNIAGGSSNVQQNLGNSSNDDGTPNIEGTSTTDSETQGLGDAHFFGNDTICCTDAGNYDAISDRDNDNIGDSCDLDDDNDGILDTVECANDLGEGNFNNWDNPTGDWTLPANGSGAFIRNSVDDPVSPITFTQEGLTGLTELQFTFSIRGSNKNNSPSTDSSMSLFYTVNGVDYIEFENTTATAAAFPIPGNLNIANGAQVSPSTFEVTDTGLTEYTVIIPWTSTEDEAIIEFRQAGSGGSDDFVVSTFSYSEETSLHLCVDTDTDSLGNHLDTDSDDDGCPDAVEAAGNFTSDQLTTFSGGSPTANSSSDNFGTTVSTADGSMGVPTQNSATPAVAVSLPQATTTAVLDSTNIAACNADLSLVKIVDKSIVKVNDKIIYTLTVKNSGPNSSSDVEITDTLPTGLTYSLGGSTVIPTGTTYNATPNVWVIGDMALNETKVLKLEATVNGVGTIVNKARVSKSKETDPDSDPTNNN